MGTLYPRFEKLKQLRDQYNISFYQLSKETGISSSIITNWKKGISFPKYDKVVKIAEYFGVTVDYFYG